MFNNKLNLLEFVLLSATTQYVDYLKHGLVFRVIRYKIKVDT